MVGAVDNGITGSAVENAVSPDLLRGRSRAAIRRCEQGLELTIDRSGSAL